MAKAKFKTSTVTAALKRCATQNQMQEPVFPQAVEFVPFPKPSRQEFFRKLPGKLAFARGKPTAQCLMRNTNLEYSRDRIHTDRNSRRL